MIAEIQSVLFLAIVLFGAAYGQAQQASQRRGVAEHSVKAEMADSNGQPLRYSFLELRPSDQGETGVRATADRDGRVVIPSVQAGQYELSVGAGGFITLSRTIEVDADQDLGRVVLYADPSVVHAASVIGLGSVPTDIQTPSLQVITTPNVLRGRIASSIFKGKRLSVQLSCSMTLPGVNQGPQAEVAQAPLNNEGNFETAAPVCSGPDLAHRELRLSLKDEHYGTIALLLPKLTMEGYFQSKIGIWSPLTPIIELPVIHAATFFLEFTDNRPLQAKLSISPGRDRFLSGETIFLHYKLTNVSDEVLALPSTSFESDFAWTITNDQGERVPLRIFHDRNAEFLVGSQALRTRILFPDETETGGLNMSLLFNLTSPGTYHVLARRIVRRPELPGEEQITSEESTFVIVARTNPN